jgi:DNA-binding beta-propeller fold protein YncE
MGASIYTSVMILPYNAAAITTLDRLESESNIIGQNTPQRDVRESPSDIAIDQGDNTVYVASSDSNTVSVIDGDILEVWHRL